MSLYREAGSRTRWLVLGAAVIAALGIGIGIGVAIGSGPTSVKSALSHLRGEVRPAIDALEIMSIEYGQRSDASEIAAARADLERARASVDRNRDDLRALDGPALQRLDAMLARLRVLVDGHGSVTAVRGLSQQAQAALRSLARIA